MGEVLFILVTIYVAYVVYATVEDKPVMGNVSVAAGEAETAPAVVPEKSAVNPIIAAVSAKAGDEVKNPKTGEVSKIPNNYRFGKRWIKEALVAEGLLDKIYKNNELDADANQKVQAALKALINIEQYQV